MRNQTHYLFIYFCVLGLLLGSAVQMAQAQDEASPEAADTVELDQAQLDQILAPIALYPDTLLSHILVASTYPLEVIQAARWRSANADLDEQQALDAVEDKDWDPSIQALVPFNDLLQKLSEDLDWLQSLGSAFLVNEQQVLTSVQQLRQKAYAQGNLTDNDYVNVEQKDNEIVIETVRKEVVYVPYYDTRVVYGNWWWHNHQPYYWHRPIHSIFSAGLYWSTGFNIRPSFYFGGFHWRNRHVVANYHYRSHANRHWSHGHNTRQVVRVNEYPRWSHNQQHRRGAQHRVNGQRIVRNINRGNNSKGYQQIDKQRILNVNRYSKKNSQYYAKKHPKSHAKRVKQALGNQQLSNKQKVINLSKSQQRQKLSRHGRTNNTSMLNTKQKSTKQKSTKQKNSHKSRKYTALATQNSQTKRFAGKTQNRTTAYHSQNTMRYKSSDKRDHKNSSNRTRSHKQNKSRVAKVARQSHSSGKQR